jgi:Ca2+-binding EF-hand superfamily protein
MGNKECRLKDIDENEIQLLLISTHFDEESIRNFYNSFVHDCPNGRITKKVFKKMFKYIQPNFKDKNNEYFDYVFK